MFGVVTFDLYMFEIFDANYTSPYGDDQAERNLLGSGSHASTDGGVPEAPVLRK